MNSPVCRTVASSNGSLVERLLSPKLTGSDGSSNLEMKQYERKEAALKKELVSATIANTFVLCENEIMSSLLGLYTIVMCQ